MKAIVCTEYGPPNVLKLKEIEKPVPQDNEILVRVTATSVTAAEGLMRKGTPYIGRLFTGLTKPKFAIPGTQFAGEIESVGQDVKHYKVGDPIFGATDIGGGCYAEYVCLSEEEVLTIKPANMSYEEAATILDGGLTALYFLRDKANIQKGQNILINGASGSVGTAAVQLAKYYEATITGVCSTTNLELVKSLGADQVIDYTQEDFTRKVETYDLIFDTVGKSSFTRCKQALKPGGIYLTTIGGLTDMVQSVWTSKIGSKKAMSGAQGMLPVEQKRQDLNSLKELIEAGAIRSVIDRQYPLEQMADAHRYVDTGHKKGNIAITVA